MLVSELDREYVASVIAERRTLKIENAALRTRQRWSDERIVLLEQEVARLLSVLAPLRNGGK
jgi:hypothetical protein